MEYKWIGAALIILGCGGFGFSLAAAHKREERCLRQLIAALDYMECELQFRLTPLPDLCRSAGQEGKGEVGQALLTLSAEIDAQISPDVDYCMAAALKRHPELPGITAENLRMLGHSLGRFDLKGQIAGLEAVRGKCRQDLEKLQSDRDSRLRNYQTLGLCAGAALAILLI